MSTTAGYAILISISVCVFAAALEGVCAGTNVKTFFATLRFPAYSAPLWVWSIIGALYYLTFGFVIYRLFRLEGDSALWYLAVSLILFMMVVNIIFRARQLRLSFIIGALFPIMDVTLFSFLIQFDEIAAWALVPYLLYRIYAVWWG